MEHKSELMMQDALANDWKAQIKPTIPDSMMFDEFVWDLYCVRDRETLHVQWTGNRLTDATYSFCGTKTHPTHKAAVLAIIKGQPSVKQIVKKNVTKRQQNQYQDFIEDLKETGVPFDLGWPAIQILKEVIGRDITWVRQFDGAILTAFVPRLPDTNPKFLRIIESRTTKRRILEWSDPEGFHAVALEQIIEVA